MGQCFVIAEIAPSNACYHLPNVGDSSTHKVILHRRSEVEPRTVETVSLNYFISSYLPERLRDDNARTIPDDQNVNTLILHLTKLNTMSPLGRIRPGRSPCNLAIHTVLNTFTSQWQRIMIQFPGNTGRKRMRHPTRNRSALCRVSSCKLSISKQQNLQHSAE